MGAVIRQATTADAATYRDLLTQVLGADYPDRQVYDESWILSQLTPGSDMETWVAESGGRLLASLSILPPSLIDQNPIANLGRQLIRPESFEDGSAGELLKKVTDLTQQRKQHSVVRVLARNHREQVLFEKLGYACVGYQPFKHMNRVREGSLFYVRVARPEMLARLPLSDALPQVKELSSLVLSNLNIPYPICIQDGTAGYPLQTETDCAETSIEEFENYRKLAPKDGMQTEISGSFNMGFGYLRTDGKVPFRAILGRRDGVVAAGLAYTVDPFDRCVRLVTSFTHDDLSLGAVLRHMLKVGQEELSAAYVEVDILVTARRLLKTLEQLGFVPIAYLAEFYVQSKIYTDVVKMVKLNMVYSHDAAEVTSSARTIVGIIDRNFQDQKLGIAIINLLRGLPIFEGLGDGELRKMARLFTQKLYRAGETIFGKGDSGNEAYVVMRGAIDILLEPDKKPIATIGNGQILGELAFLDGAKRGAIARASQPSILLIIQRSAFNMLAQQEPQLGMVVMRNIARELSNRLRKTTLAMAAMPK